MVPTLDGGERFRRCLAALVRQRPAADACVVIDSGSSDGTADAAREAGATLLQIPAAEFDHGATRNAGAAALPDVDVIVFLVQDAVPRGDDWLVTLARAALADGVAAATARQVPPPDASALTRATVERSPMASAEERRTGPFSAAELAAFSPGERVGVLRLDDIACAVRAPLFRAVGFPATSFGEDALLAWDLLHAGWALAHEPRAVVEHGHEYDPESVAPRYEQDARFFRETFGFRARPGVLSWLKGLCSEMFADRRWLTAEFGEPPFEQIKASRELRKAQLDAQRRGSKGPLGGPPTPRPLPSPRDLAA